MRGLHCELYSIKYCLMLRQIPQRENITALLGISTATLNDTSEADATRGNVPIRTILNTTCQLKTCINTLAEAESALERDEHMEDLELSAMKLVVTQVYQQSCKLVSALHKLYSNAKACSYHR